MNEENIIEIYQELLKSIEKIKTSGHTLSSGQQIQLSQYGPKIFASSNEKNFELATDRTIDDLKKLLNKRKGKMKPYL